MYMHFLCWDTLKFYTTTLTYFYGDNKLAALSAPVGIYVYIVWIWNYISKQYKLNTNLQVIGNRDSIVWVHKDLINYNSVCIE